MCPQGNREDKSVFRLNRKLFYPLLVLLALPLAAAGRSFMISGPTGRNLMSLGLTALLISLFLPWLTKRVIVSPKGIASSSLFSRSFIAWAEVTKVNGYEFRGRSLIMIEGGGRRMFVTDIIGNFGHLVGYAVEHASRALIDEDVRGLLMHRGRTGRDALLLWLAAAAMLVLMILKLTWR